MTRPVTLQEIVKASQTIVQGHVVNARVEPHPTLRHLKTVVVTLAVDDTLKGNVQKLHTFRQFIWDTRDFSNAAGYSKGQEVLLFLNPVNKRGLTSPVGLEQGRFEIRRDSQGNKSVANGVGNYRLFQGLAPVIQKNNIKVSPAATRALQEGQAGTFPLDDFKTIVRGLEVAK